MTEMRITTRLCLFWCWVPRLCLFWCWVPQPNPQCHCGTSQGSLDWVEVDLSALPASSFRVICVLWFVYWFVYSLFLISDLCIDLCIAYQYTNLWQTIHKAIHKSQYTIHSQSIHKLHFPWFVYWFVYCLSIHKSQICVLSIFDQRISLALTNDTCTFLLFGKNKRVTMRISIFCQFVTPVLRGRQRLSEELPFEMWCDSCICCTQGSRSRNGLYEDWESFSDTDRFFDTKGKEVTHCLNQKLQTRNPLYIHIYIYIYMYMCK